MKPDIVFLGNVTIDDTVMPDGTTKMACMGGDTIYASLAASLWKPNIGMLAPLGNDFPPQNLIKINEKGWTSGAFPLRNVPTLRSWVIYESDGRRTWVARSDMNDFYELSPWPTDISNELMQADTFFILAMDFDAQENLIDFLSENGKRIAIDSQENYVLGYEDRLKRMLAKVDIYLPSQIEAEHLLKHGNHLEALKELASLGPSIVGIKLGAEGALIYDKNKDQIVKIPTYWGEVIDTTGAGDAFCGGFISKFYETNDILLGGIAGAVSSSFAIQDFGIDFIYNVTPIEAEMRFQEMINKIRTSLD